MLDATTADSWSRRHVIPLLFSTVPCSLSMVVCLDSERESAPFRIVKRFMRDKLFMLASTAGLWHSGGIPFIRPASMWIQEENFVMGHDCERDPAFLI